MVLEIFFVGRVRIFLDRLIYMIHALNDISVSTLYKVKVIDNYEQYVGSKNIVQSCSHQHSNKLFIMGLFSNMYNKLFVFCSKVIPYKHKDLAKQNIFHPKAVMVHVIKTVN